MCRYCLACTRTKKIAIPRQPFFRSVDSHEETLRFTHARQPPEHKRCMDGGTTPPPLPPYLSHTYLGPCPPPRSGRRRLRVRSRRVLIPPAAPAPAGWGCLERPSPRRGSRYPAAPARSAGQPGCRRRRDVRGGRAPVRRVVAPGPRSVLDCTAHTGHVGHPWWEFFFWGGAGTKAYTHTRYKVKRVVFSKYCSCKGLSYNTVC